MATINETNTMPSYAPVSLICHWKKSMLNRYLADNQNCQYPILASLLRKKKTRRGKKPKRVPIDRGFYPLGHSIATPSEPEFFFLGPTTFDRRDIPHDEPIPGVVYSLDAEYEISEENDLSFLKTSDFLQPFHTALLKSVAVSRCPPPEPDHSVSSLLFATSETLLFFPEQAASRGQGLIDFGRLFDGFDPLIVIAEAPVPIPQAPAIPSYTEADLLQRFRMSVPTIRHFFPGVVALAARNGRFFLKRCQDECGIAQSYEETVAVDWTYFPPPPLPLLTLVDRWYMNVARNFNRAPRENVDFLTNRFSCLEVEDYPLFEDCDATASVEVVTADIPKTCVSFGGFQWSCPLNACMHVGDTRGTDERRITSWQYGHVGFVEEESPTRWECPHVGGSYHDVPLLNLKVSSMQGLIDTLRCYEGDWQLFDELVMELSGGDDDIESMLRFGRAEDLTWMNKGKFYPFSQNGVIRRMRNRRKRLARATRARKTLSDEFVLSTLMKSNQLSEKAFKSYEEDLRKQRRETRHCGVLTCDLFYTCTCCFRCDHHDLCKTRKDFGKRRRAQFRRRLERTPPKVRFADETGPAQGVSFSRGRPDVSLYPTKFDLNTELAMKFDVDSITNFFTQMFPSRPTATWKNQIAGVVLLLTGLWQNRGSLSNCMTHVAQYLNVLNLGSGLYAQAYELIAGFFPRLAGDVGRAQAGGMEETLSRLREWIPALAGCSMVLATLTVLRELPSGGSVTDLINRFSRMGQCVSSIEKLVEYGKSVGTTTYDWICKHVFDIDTTKCDAWSEINQWCDDVSELNNTNYEMEIRGNAAMKAQVDTLLIRGDKILKLLDSLKVEFSKRTRITNLMILLNKFRETAAGSGAGQFYSRVNPYILWVTGASGVGKSTILDLLNTELLQSMGCTDASDLGEKVYYRNPSDTDQYWSGYSNEVKIVVCDDQFARKDTEANPSQEPYEVIRMGNNAAWQLPMAHLMDKGTTFFRANTVIWTTNRSQVKFVSLTNPEAVYRRVCAKWRQQPKIEFATERTINGKKILTLDQEKVRLALLEDPTKITEFVEFQQMDSDASTERQIGHPLSYREWADRIVAENKANLVRHELVQGAKNTYWEKMKPRYHGEVGNAQMMQEQEEVPVFDAGLVYHANPGAFNIGGWVHINVRDCPGFESAAAPRRLGAPPNYPIGPETKCLHVHGELAEDAVRGWQHATARAQLAARHHQKWVFDTIFYEQTGLAANRVATCVLAEHNPPDEHEETLLRKLMNATLGVKRVLDKASNSKIGKMIWKVVKAPWYIAKWASDCIYEVRPFLNWRYAFVILFCVVLRQTWSEPFGWMAPLGQFLKPLHEWIWKPTKETQPKPGKVDMTFFDKEGYKVDRKVPTDLADLILVACDRAAAEGYEKAPQGRPKTSVEGAYEKATAGRSVAKVETYEPPKFGRPVIKTDKGGKTECRSDLVVGEECKSPIKAGWLDSMIFGIKSGEEYHVKPFTRPVHLVNGVRIEGFEEEAAKPERGPLQMICDQNASENAAIVFRNLYCLEFKDSRGEWQRAMNILFIQGRIAICNRHVLTNMAEEWRIRNLSIPNGYLFNLKKLPCLFAPDDHQIHGKKDVVMFVFPDNLHQHPNIVKKFMTSDDFSRFSSLGQICLTGYRTTETVHPYSQAAQNCTAFDAEFTLIGSTGAQVGKIRRYFKYGIQTTVGDCGAVIIAYDSAFNRKIIGIHAAGTANPEFAGVGQPVSQEFLEFLLKAIPKVRADALMSPDPEIKSDLTAVNEDGKMVLSLPIPGNFVQHGQVQGAHEVTKSRIFPSPVWNVIAEPLTKPAHLKPFVNDEGERIDPKALAQIKAAGVPPPVDTDVLADCVHGYSQDVLSCKGDASTSKYDRVLTLEESIAGVEGEEFLAPINRSTSPGFGWDKKGKGKTKWLGEDEYIFDNKEILTKHTKMLNDCKAGIRPSVFWQDVLKDERRPMAKVDAGKTRLFSVGDMVFNLIFRQYFLGFAAHMMINRIELESCIGTNVYSRDWSLIAERIQQLGDKVIAGDFSNYDGTLNAQFLWAVLEVIDNFYEAASAEDKLVRRALWSEIVNSIHVSGNHVYMWTHSNPSGCPLTAILNSVYHSLSARYVFIALAWENEAELANMQAYNKYVRHVNYGDDDVWNISDSIISWFNQDTIAKAYETIGMTYTDEAKTGTCLPFRKMSEIAFLKREFRWDETQARYRAPLSLDTIREMPMWVRSRVDVYELTATTLEEAVHELAQHGRDVFERELPRFEEARRIIGKRVNCTFLSYDAYQQLETVRWCATQSNEEKPRDRGSIQIDETSGAANPAEVRKSLRTYAVSGLFSPIGECVDTLNDRLLTRRAGRYGLSSPPSEETGLAQSNESSSAGGTSSILPGAASIDEREELILFHEEGEIASGGFTGSALSHIVKPAKDSLTNDVVGFLSRPIKLASFAWATAQAAYTDLTPAINLPFAWLNNPMVREKLQGFRYIRMDLEFKWQINAQPFNAGRLLMVFLPMQQQLASTPSNQWYFGGLTGYPHVELDLSESTSGTLTVPFIMPLMYIDLINGAGCMGQVRTIVYSPLTGSADVDATVWMRAMNIDVQMPTGLPLVTPLPGDSGPAQSNEDPWIAPDGSTSVPELISETGDAPGIEAEQAASSSGTKISKIMRTTGTIGKALGLIPTVGPFIAAAGWVASAVGGIAALFGYSKPVDGATVTMVVPQYARNLANFAGDSKAKMLALDNRNNVAQPIGLYGTNKDEMSLAYILSRPVYMDRFSFTQVQPQDAIIWSWPVDPAWAVVQTISTPTPRGTFKLNTMLSYLSESFQFWRGSIEYNFKLIKTVFHSGRFRVVFVPSATPETDVTTIDFNKCYNQVYDIRELTNFCFSVPFVNNAPWKPLTIPRDVLNRTVNTSRCTGMLYVQVLNSLRNPATAADTIDIIVETRAGDDFQYGFFGTNDELPIAYIMPTVAPTDGQMDEFGPAQGCEQLFPSPVDRTYNPNQIGMGEVITSTRQILKRYVPLPGVLPAPSNIETKLLRYWPQITGASYNGTAVGIAADNVYNSTIDRITQLFRFKSGAMRVMISAVFAKPEAAVANAINPWIISAFSYLEGNPANPPTGLFVEDDQITRFGERTFAIPQQMYFPNQEGVVEVDVPFYQPYPISLTDVGRPSYQDETSNSRVPYNAGTSITVEDNGAAFVRLIPGEDFSFGYLMGPPVTGLAPL